jgi:hypothetical protein
VRRTAPGVAVEDKAAWRYVRQQLPEAAFTPLLCGTDLQLVLFSPTACEAAILEDGVRDHYFAATRETH